jgi:hypothetical protein
MTKVREYNAATGETITRDLTPEEQAVWDQNVVAAAEANTLFSAEQPISTQKLRTTNATATEIWRFPTGTNTGYILKAALTAVDSGNGDIYHNEVTVTFKNLNGNVSRIGAFSIPSNMPQQDAGASSWTVIPSVDGVDLVLSVRGAAGRNIDWNLTGTILRFTPGGFDRFAG